MNQQEVHTQLVIKACRDQNPSAQKKLFELFYGYAMSIALRYANRKEDAEEILSESFYKMFKKIDQYDSNYNFKYWFRRIIINSAIDYSRKYKNKTNELDDKNASVLTDKNLGMEHLHYEDLMKMIQTLSPKYRTVFNMYAIDGFKHHEISEQLGISVSTSKTNYMKARKALQLMIYKTNLKHNQDEG